MPAGVHLFKLAFALDIFLLVNFTWEELLFIRFMAYGLFLKFQKAFPKRKKTPLVSCFLEDDLLILKDLVSCPLVFIITLNAGFYMV